MTTLLGENYFYVTSERSQMSEAGNLKATSK
jgi:hypothetical protein